MASRQQSPETTHQTSNIVPTAKALELGMPSRCRWGAAAAAPRASGGPLAPNHQCFAPALLAFRRAALEQEAREELERENAWWRTTGAVPNVHLAVTPKEWKGLILSAAPGQLVVVDYLRPSCAACRTLAPKVKQLAEENSDLIVVKVRLCRGCWLAALRRARVGGGAAGEVGLACLSSRSRQQGSRGAQPPDCTAGLHCQIARHATPQSHHRRLLIPLPWGTTALPRLLSLAPPPLFARAPASHNCPSLPSYPGPPILLQVNTDEPGMRELAEAMGVQVLPWFQLWKDREPLCGFTANVTTISRLRAEVAAHKPCIDPECDWH